MASTAGSFKNHYYQRAVATAKPCYICHRQTTIVLSTVDTSDFLYTCASHLTDPGFASPIASTTTSAASGSSTPTKDKPKLSDAEIKKIAEEWEEKQRLKKEKEKADKDKDASDTKDKDGEKKKIPPPAPIPVPTSTSPAPAVAPSHPQFVLHRQIFAMRQAEHRKRRQAAQVKAVAPRLPSVPSGGGGVA